MNFQPKQQFTIFYLTQLVSFQKANQQQLDGGWIQNHHL